MRKLSGCVLYVAEIITDDLEERETGLSKTPKVLKLC